MHIRRLGRRDKNPGQAGPKEWDASALPPSGQVHFRSELRTAGELAGRVQPPASEADEPQAGTAA